MAEQSTGALALDLVQGVQDDERLYGELASMIPVGDERLTGVAQMIVARCSMGALAPERGREVMRETIDLHTQAV